MRKTVTTALIAILVSASSTQTASAADRHVRKGACGKVTAAQQFRYSYGSLAAPSAEQLYYTSLANGAQTSGIAGR
jgi:hypothetical protein